MRPLHLWIIRICISAGLLAVVFWFLPVGAVWSAMRAIPVMLWLAVLGIFLLAHCLSAVKWWLLTDQAQVPLGAFLRAHFVGLMSNLCLPGVAGGDVVRAAWVLRHGVVKMKIGVASLADRLLDTLSLLVLAILGAAFVAESNETTQRTLLMIGSFLGVCLFGLIAILLVLVWWRPVEGKLGQVVQVLTEYGRKPGLLIRSFALSLLIQSGFVGMNILIGISIGVESEIAVWFVSWPLAKLAALVPVTLSGLGVRESVLVLLMKPFGADAPAVAATGLLWQTILLAGGLVGGLVALNLNAKRQPDDVSSRRAKEAKSS